eukprot:GDKI01014199.1.p1 GENE.GDKI01014199.1~~GDKI01014199.1.p1  ORF type:complete len:303 (-),score=84.77 GDKI01014199.1:23-856(-)
MRVSLFTVCLAFASVLSSASAIAIRGAANTDHAAALLTDNQYLSVLASDLQVGRELDVSIAHIETQMLEDVRTLERRILGGGAVLLGGVDVHTHAHKDEPKGKEEVAPPVSEKSSEEQVKDEEKEDKEAVKQVDAAMPFSLDDIKHMRKEQIPLFLDFLKSFVERFKKHIGDANRMEQRSIEFYKEVMEKEKKHEEPEVVVKYAKRMRAAQHKHYHSMLKLAHAGLQRIQMAIKALETVMDGKDLPADWKSIQHELQAFIRVAVVQLSTSVQSTDPE